MFEQISQLKRRSRELEKELQSAEVVSSPLKLAAASKEYNEIQEKISLGEELEKVARALDEAEKTKAEAADDEMKELAEEEIHSLSAKKAGLEQELRAALLPADPRDNKNVIMEIRAGAGGDESALFAAELFRLYSRFAERHGWKTNLLATSRIGIGGFKEVIFEIAGRSASSGVFGALKHEAGVHRVQRVPETEKSGRVHTSTVTIAILPEVEETEFKIDPKDLKIETSTSRGHGGQSVNTTYSAIRMTHMPTGITVSCQDERSQQQNRAKAMLIMRSRLLAHHESERSREEREQRAGQIGAGDRSEKIRTYNFPQDRLTDHRLKQNWHNLAAIMDGEIGEIIEALREEEVKKKLHGLYPPFA